MGTFQGTLVSPGLAGLNVFIDRIIYVCVGEILLCNVFETILASSGNEIKRKALTIKIDRLKRLIGHITLRQISENH